jgi:hypothetical protein
MEDGIMAIVKSCYEEIVVDSPFGTSNEEFLGWWQDAIELETGMIVPTQQLQKLETEWLSH